MENVGVGMVKCIKQFMIMANSWLDLGLKHLKHYAPSDSIAKTAAGRSAI